MINPRYNYAARVCASYNARAAIKTTVINEIVSWYDKVPVKYVSPVIAKFHDFVKHNSLEELENYLRFAYNVQLYWMHKELKYLCGCSRYNKGIRLEQLVDAIDDKGLVIKLLHEGSPTKETLVLFAKFVYERYVPNVNAFSQLRVRCDLAASKYPFIILSMLEWQQSEFLIAFIKQMLQYNKQSCGNLLGQLDYCNNSLEDVLYALSCRPEYTVEPYYYIEKLADCLTSKIRDEFIEAFSKFSDLARANIMMNIMSNGCDFCGHLFDFKPMPEQEVNE